MSGIYRCPVCQSLLNASSNNGLVCGNNHQFDRHKKGYVNLLLAQDKRSKQPGDDKAMIQGRRAFLNAGHYQPLVKKITEILSSLPVMQVLDAGCGEGYYLNTLSTVLPEIEYWGFDISKPAILQASSYKHCEWAVASTTQMPYMDNSFDLILSVFSRVNLDEFMRVLKPQGYILFIGPGHEHLLALRHLIYSDVKAYDESKQQEVFSSEVSLLEELSLTFNLALPDQATIQNLLKMTPHGQRLDKEAKERLENLDHFNDQADFRLYLYQKIK